MLSTDFRYITICGIGAVLGLFVGIGIRGDLTLGAACFGTAIGTFFGGLTPIMYDSERIELLSLAIATFALSVIIATVVGVVGGGMSPFTWQCLILGFLIGASISIPMFMHSLIVLFINVFRKKKGAE